MTPKKAVSTSPNFYRSLMDWWVAVLIILLLLVLVGWIPVVIYYGLPWIQTVAMLFFLILAALYFIDLAFFTHYHLEPEGLLVVSQFRHYFFPYRQMKSIDRGGWLALFSWAGQKRFALSADNLKINLHHHSFRSITVSPQNKQRFLDHLLKKIDQERSSRVSNLKNQAEI